MDQGFERARRRASFEIAHNYLKKLLSEGSLSEEEYVAAKNHLAEKSGVDPVTGLDLPAAPCTPRKKPRDERYLTYENLSELAKYESCNSANIIITWLRSHKTFEFLRQWEKMNNRGFSEEGYQALMASGNKTITPKVWCEKTNAIGILSRQGNGGGTYAHPAIALDFVMWQRPIIRYALLSSLADQKKPVQHPSEEQIPTVRVIPPKPVE